MYPLVAPSVRSSFPSANFGAVLLSPPRTVARVAQQTRCFGCLSCLLGLFLLAKVGYRAHRIVCGESSAEKRLNMDLFGRLQANDTWVVGVQFLRVCTYTHTACKPKRTPPSPGNLVFCYARTRIRRGRPNESGRLYIRCPMYRYPKWKPHLGNVVCG